MDKFKDIYAKNLDYVYHFLLQMTKDPILAEDLTEETFYKAMLAFDSFRNDCQTHVWLCQIAKNTYYSYLRKNKKIIFSDTVDTLHHSVDPLDGEQIILNKENIMELHQLLHLLEDPYKEVFHLRVFGELNFKQIGYIFSKSEHWACVTYHRAKEKIRKGLKTHV